MDYAEYELIRSDPIAQVDALPQERTCPSQSCRRRLPEALSGLSLSGGCQFCQAETADHGMFFKGMSMLTILLLHVKGSGCCPGLSGLSDLSGAVSCQVCQVSGAVRSVRLTAVRCAHVVPACRP